jgi:hypothetical protein
MHRLRNVRRCLARHAVAASGIALALGCGSPEQVLLGRGLSTSSAEAGGEVAGGRVLGFVLVDVKTRVDLRPLADGDTIDTTGDPVSIRALVDPLDPGSVVFMVDDKWVRTEENPPWMIAGNDPNTGAVYAWSIASGTHRVKATPHSAPGGGGVAGVALEQTFAIQ